MNKEIYHLYYNGVVILDGTYDECYTKLAQIQSNNYAYATSKSGGYKIIKSKLWV